MSAGLVATVDGWVSRVVTEPGVSQPPNRFRFKQYVESRWYAERGVPRFIVAFFSVLGARALEQDREVWANKICKTLRHGSCVPL